MRRIILVCLLSLTALIFSVGTFAKDLDKFLLRAYLYDAEYQAVDSVEVSLVKNDSIPVKFKLLTGKGDNNTLNRESQLRMLVESGLGDYTLFLEKPGFEPLVKNFKVASVSQTVVFLNSLVLQKERHVELKELTVTSTRVKMVLKGDTIEYDAAAFQLNDGSMLDALVRQLPGVTLSEDGVISVNGRKVNELLINGKDFFQGDPKVALQNLPAYTVKNVQVYDKAEKDAYLTYSDAKIDTKEDEQQLVMDVNLKKDYNTGWMANVEAGGGTSSRYRARAFGLGYTDKLRISVFGNANNVGDTDKASAAGKWGNGWSEDGNLNIKMGGIDYNYNDNKRIENFGSVTVTHENVNADKISASTNFYPTGDLFSRSVNLHRETKSHLMFKNTFRFKHDNFFISFIPVVDWLVRDRSNNDRSATFTVNPPESYRGEAIDSLFSRRFQSSYSKSMLTALHRLNAMHDTWIDLQGTLNVTIRPKTWKGVLQVYANGRYFDTPSRERTLYRQTLGTQSQGGIPVESDRFSPISAIEKTLSSGLSYDQSIRKFTDTHSRTFSFSGYFSYSYALDNKNIDFFTGENAGDMDCLPSLYSPENLKRDYLNSKYTRNTTNTLSPGGRIGFAVEPITRGDSTFNGAFNAFFSLTANFQQMELDYVKPTILDEHLKRDVNLLNPTLYLSLNSSNNVRYLSLSLNGMVYRTAPLLSYLVNTVDNSDPLNIYYGNPSGLENATTYSATLRFMRSSRSVRRSFFNSYLNWRATTNQVAMATTYNPATGVREMTPRNISGNWNATFYGGYSIQLGSRQQTQYSASLNASYTNSVDFIAIDVTPTRSSVRNLVISPSMHITYKFNKGSFIGVALSTGWNRATSPRKNFSKIEARNHSAHVHGTVSLPYDFEINSSLSLDMRRGYQDSAMNTTEWLWNATVSKSVLKGALSFKLTAYDILNSVKTVFVTVNAQGRTETWRNSLPRYVMLSAAYRFDMKPRNSKQ